MKRAEPTASGFSIVLGLSSLGQGWIVASRTWGLPPAIGLSILAAAAAVWATLLGRYAVHAVTRPGVVVEELRHVATGPSGALPGIATMLMGLALLPHWRLGGITLALAGLAWQLPFSLWHAGGSWQHGRAVRDTAPNIYLPTVAGNLTAGGVLGALGWASWGWLFLGAGIFSWLALESIVAKALWTPDHLPLQRRALVGIHFAPPAVATMAWLLLEPAGTDRLLILVWGYALFQILLGIRLAPWLLRQPFAISYWSYTFGVGSFAISSLKLAALGFAPAHAVAPVAFVIANVLVVALTAALLSGGLRKRRVVPSSPASDTPSQSRPAPRHKAELLTSDLHEQIGNAPCQ